MDIGLTLVLAIPFLTLLPAIYLAMRLTSRGHVFYRHTRIGKDGQCFEVWKFRSMVLNSEEVLNAHLTADPEAKLEWEKTQKLKHDPRVSPVGRWLRRWSVDELPQLWNVMRGEMSLVGPRPITPDEIPRYGDVSELYKSVRPGITGLWQVSGRSNTSYEERISLDESYVKSRSLRLDIRILVRTIPAMLSGEGAC